MFAEFCRDMYIRAYFTFNKDKFVMEGDNYTDFTKAQLVELIADLQKIHNFMVDTKEGGN